MSPTHLWSSSGCLSFIALLAGCSDGTVNLGGGREPRTVQLGERCSSGASIVQGPITVHDQSELEQLAGCEQIDGDLHIEVFEGADLRPLSALRVVDGLLEIGAYPEASNAENADLGAIKAQVDEIVASGYLPSLAGLERLQRASALQLGYIAAEDLEPLFGLRQLSGRASQVDAGSLVIQGAANLRNLHGLANIESVRELAIAETPALSSLDELQLSARMNNINLLDSPLLADLGGLGGVISAYSVGLSNLGISDLDGLSQLNFVEGGVSLDGNSLLLNMDRLAPVRVTGTLEVTDNALLQSIPSLRQMSLDRLRVIGNPALKSLHIDLGRRGDGPDYLRGSAAPNPMPLIDIGHNDSLSEISLSAGVESGRLAAIYDNAALVHVSIGTLQSLEELDITGNPNLVTIDVGALQTVDRLSVINNPQLDVAQLGTVRTFTSIVGRNATSP